MTTHHDQFGDPIHITADPEDNTILIDIAPHEPNNTDTLRSLPLPAARALRDELTRLIDQQTDARTAKLCTIAPIAYHHTEDGRIERITPPPHNWQPAPTTNDEDACNASHPADPMATDPDN